ncbi:tyrosine-type recombinase/integrase [Nocardiopsis chromatogenes]|uniref:tyrosine-type recombinase/integrase n=1 Tax=Nocardiopsis chromatogenes TaxID=280239 RepID=UPI0003496760|nr:tyrosine-type recombinase/integrase [Nocardiopsis chromatogenes]
MARTEGSIFKRCGCRNTTTGKLLGAACPRLKRPGGAWSSAHGAWGFQLELPRTDKGARRQARRIGLPGREEALEQLDHTKALLTLAEDDEHTAVQIANLICHTLKTRKHLPTTEEVKQRTTAGAALRVEVPTVAEWLTEWLETKTRLAPATRRSYSGHITNYLTPHLGRVRLDKLQVGHLQAMFEAIEEHNTHIRACRESDDPKVRASVRGQRTVSLSSKHRIRATLRSALTAAIARPDLPVQVNAASHLQLPSCPRVKPMVWTPDRVARYNATGEVPSPVMVWTPEQAADFLDRAGRDRLYALFHLVAMKGLRRGEAVGLQWDAVRLADGQIDIRSQVVQLGWQTLTTTPKSESGRRTITLDATTVDVLKAWRAHQGREHLKAGKAWTDSQMVFTHPDGSPLHPAWVTDLFQRIGHEAGLPPIGLHGLRHGAASNSLAAGVDVKVVSAELGHSTTYFTQDTYQTVFPEVAREAAEATAAMIPLKNRKTTTANSR